MESIIQEFISNIVKEDIETYILLHKEISENLLDYCAIMTNQLYQEYQLIY